MAVKQMADRPFGIAILAVLGLIMGIIVLLASIVLLGFSGLLSVAFLSDPSQAPVVGLVATLGVLGGVIALIVAIIILLASRGLWNGSNWARILLMIIFALNGLSAIWSLVQAGAILTGPLVSIVIAVIFLYYLTRSHVVAYF